MLTFDEKLAIIASFTALQRKDVSMGRVNFHYEASIVDKKIVVYHLPPHGNGFVYAEHVPNTTTDDKGFVNIREYSTDELRYIIEAAIASISASLSEENWTDADGQILKLVVEDDLWNVYTGSNLEMAFETYTEAKQYLKEEGFSRS
jgi:hypothetical protein